MPDHMYNMWHSEVRTNKTIQRPDTLYPAPKDPFGNEMVTLSKGKFKEDADLTDSTRVGSVLMKCPEGTVIRYLSEARVYESGRFLSVDPLTKDYPELTPYQFASNTPIQAIDLDGLEAFFIHGTWANPAYLGNNLINKVSSIFGNFTIINDQWSGENNPSARNAEASKITNKLIDTRVECGSSCGEPITLFGHSHGGNIAILVANRLVSIGAYEPSEINVVTLNTPVRSDYQLSSKDINHYNIYNNNDVIQILGQADVNTPLGTGSLGRTYDNAVNIEYNDQIPFFDSSGCGVSGHCGTATTNTEVWMPKLEKAVNEKKINEKETKVD